MKTLRFLISGIFCILLSYSLCSCGGGEDDDVVSPDTDQSGGTVPIPSTSTKKLTEIVVEHYELEDCKTIKFQYDNQGNLSFVSITGYDGYDYDEEISEFTYKYEGDKILVSGIEGKNLDGSDAGEIEKKTYYLLNGKVISIKCEEEDADYNDEREHLNVQTYYNFEYDNTNNHLTRVGLIFNSSKYTNSSEEEFSWFDDKINAISEPSYNFHNYYYYTEPITCKGFCPILPCLNSDALYECYLLMVNPELASIKVNILPNSSSAYGIFTYELDNDGYIKRMCTQREGYTPIYYILTWK